MVLWQGLTEGGTAVPVQVTEAGKVVAIGETGPEGPQGPEGPPGPPGQPGQAEWPPNPIEGAFLVWLNGEPTWYTEQPIPTPPGTAGPITQVNDNSVLVFDNDVDQNIFFAGVQVYAVNADGSNWNGDNLYNTSQTWSDAITSPQGALNAIEGFDGDTNTYMKTSPAPINITEASLLFTPATSVAVNRLLRMYVYADSSESSQYQRYSINNGDTVSYLADSSSPGWKWINTGFVGPLDSLEWTRKKKNSNSGGIDVGVIEVDGKILLNPKAGPYPTGQVTSAVTNTVLLSRVQGAWIKGLYMKADESAQAAWLISKNKR